VEILVEAGKEPLPAAIRLDAQTLEFVSKSGKPLSQPSLDFGLEQAQTIVEVAHSTAIIGPLRRIDTRPGASYHDRLDSRR
jgi:hypothetical protein